MSALYELTRRARHRHIRNLIVAEAVRAASAGLGGAILLLLVGTEILDWRWIGALVLATVGLGIHRTLRRVPTDYAILQGIDWRLKLKDSLSTGFFFQEAANGHRFSAPMRAAQLAQAERLAGGIDSARAVPLARPRALYLLLPLAAVASGLFGLRYAVSRHLDLRPPLARILFPGSYEPARPQVAARQQQPKDRLKQILEKMGLSVENEPGRTSESATGEALSSEAEEAEAVRRLDQPGVTPLQVESEEGDVSGEPGSRAPRSASELADSQAGERDRSASGRQASNAPGENQNLLEQFRDALSNLLSRLKMQPRAGDSQMTASTRAEADASGSREGRREKGQSGSGRQQSEGSPDSESSADEEGQATQQAQGASGRPGGRDADLQASREGRSGIGREDGDKQAREAEQLAAMGKISEILGRRQATLSGEVTVEVTSGTQKLRTPYTQQPASHAEAGGEIHRDEVPLLFQPYVQKYFEEVRKPPPAAKPAPAPR